MEEAVYGNYKLTDCFTMFPNCLRLKAELDKVKEVFITTLAKKVVQIIIRTIHLALGQTWLANGV